MSRITFQREKELTIISFHSSHYIVLKDISNDFFGNQL